VTTVSIEKTPEEFFRKRGIINKEYLKKEREKDARVRHTKQMSSLLEGNHSCDPGNGSSLN
jgi:hypothetical protein